MARFRASSTVLGYQPGEEFDAEPNAETDAYVAGGHLVRLDAAVRTEDDLAEVLADAEPVAGPAFTDLASAKVPDLRAWLASRDLDTTGKRADLVARVEATLDEHDAPELG
jgi:hypothetical protein